MCEDKQDALQTGALSVIESTYQSLRAALPETITIRLNSNRRTLVSLRPQKNGGMRLSVHKEMLSYVEVLPDLVRYVSKRGRGRYPVLNTVMQRVFDEHCLPARVQQQDPVWAERLNDLPLLSHCTDSLEQLYQAIHSGYFSHLSRPELIIKRRPPQRRRRSIQYGSYHAATAKVGPQVRITPLITQNWIPVCFLEHVLHHELCHHAQRSQPMQRERMHSARFKKWEQEYNMFVEAVAWERVNRERLLSS